MLLKMNEKICAPSCEHCGEPMTFERMMPKSPLMPEFRTFVCSDCSHSDRQTSYARYVIGKGHNMKIKPWLFSLLAKLGKDKRASGPRLLARLIRDEAGSYLIYMGFTLPVLIGVGGLAGEAGLLLYNYRTLQSAADAAAYSAAVAYSNNYTALTHAQATSQAQAVVASYGFALGTSNNQANVTVAWPPTQQYDYAGSPNTAIQVSISRPQSSIFSSFWSFASLPNNVLAIAVVKGGGGSTFGGGNCVLVLGNTALGQGNNNAANAMQIQGGGNAININAPDCGIFSDSTAGNTNNCASDSVAFGGSATVVAASFGSAGCISVTGSSTITLPTGATYTQKDGSLSDPYAGLPSCSATVTTQCIPTTSSAGSCTATTSVNSSGWVKNPGTLCPGVYSNGIGVDITGCGSACLPVVLNPGIYILDCSASTCPSQGNTTASLLVKNGTLTDGTTASTIPPTAGETLLFTCPSCSASQWPSNGIFVGANGNLSLSAPNSGSTAGFVMMGDPNMPLNTAFDNHANPTAILNGTVWMPNGAFAWGGTPSTVSGSSSCLEMIVNMMQFYGNSGFSSDGCALSAGGGSGGAGKPIGSKVTLVY
jgi:hypothetical protein